MKKSKLSQYMSELGKKGGAALLKKRGPAYFALISKAGWDKRRREINNTNELTNEKDRRK